MRRIGDISVQYGKSDFFKRKKGGNYAPQPEDNLQKKRRQI